MATAKVTINGNTILDLTDATASASEVLSTYTAYGSDGNKITGQAVVSPVLQTKTKTYTPTETTQSETIIADSGYDGLNNVEITVNAISSTYVGSSITQRSSTDLTASGATVTAPAGYYVNNATKTIVSGEAATPATTITANPSISVNDTGLITATISASQNITPTVSAGYISTGTAGTISVDGNNTEQLTTQAAATITPTESEQTAVTAGVFTTGVVKVGAISSTYVGSGIDQRDSTDLTASGATVSVPAGYYAAAASKSIASGSEGAPTASKGTVSNHSISITPSVTNTGGYIAGGTHTGTAVSVAASELVSGTLTIDSSGTKDVTNYASASVAAGAVTAPSNISDTTASVSTGTNTLTLSKTVSVTPNVTTAGYISSGTAGNATVSLTANVTTKAAATITPSTSNQTIASGTYLTGTQTIAGDADLVAANIKTGVSIFNVTGSFTSDATAAAADIATNKTAYVNGAKITGTLSFQTIYSGSSEPASSLGTNGDIYIQS